MPFINLLLYYLGDIFFSASTQTEYEVWERESRHKMSTFKLEGERTGPWKVIFISSKNDLTEKY